MKPPKKTLSALGEERTQAFVERLRNSMAEIDKEISENDGIYPRNSGRLNATELCRRAKVSVISLYGQKHSGTTKLEVNAWLARLRVDTPTSAKGARRRAHSQAMSWKEKYEVIAAEFKNMYSIEIVRRDAMIAGLRKEVSVLKSQIRSHAGAGSKVVGIASAAKRKSR